MIKIKVNGKPHEVPEKWEEVTFAQFLQILKAKDDSTEIVPILLGLSPEEVNGAKIQGLELLLTKVNFLRKEPPICETPERLGPYTLPKDIGFETTHQFEDTKTEIFRLKDEKDLVERTKALAYYTAIYLQGIFKEPYDSDKARKLVDTVMTYPCLEVMAAGSFFQAKCLSITNGLSMSYLRQNTLLKKKRPGLNRLMRRLVSMVHWIRSRDMWAKTRKASLNGAS